MATGSNSARPEELFMASFKLDETDDTLTGTGTVVTPLLSKILVEESAIQIL